MPVNYTSQPIDDSLNSYLQDLKKDIFLNFKCHDIGTIKAVDLTKQTVTVDINYYKTVLRENKAQNTPQDQYRPDYVPKSEPYPVLLDVPFIVLTGGESGITFPIKVGDQCLVLYNDRAIEEWFATGKKVVLTSNRLHAIGDGIALVGIRSLKTLIQGYDATRAVLYSGTTKIAVGAKIEIKNDAQSLGPILQDLSSKLNDLVTQIKLITVICAAPGNPSSPPVNVAAFTALGIQLQVVGTKLNGILE